MKSIHSQLVGNKYDNIKFYEENCTVNFGNVPIFFCPWINAENYASTMKGSNQQMQKFVWVT